MRRSTAGSSSTATTSVWLKMVWSGIVLCVGASVWASWMHLHQQQNQQHHLQQQKMQQQHLQHLQHLQQQTIPTPLQFSSSTTTTTTTNRGGVAAGLLEFAQKSQPHNHQTPRNQKKHQQSQQQQRKDLSSSYPTLQCQAFGGPSVQDAQEMVYWQDIPSDSHYVSPFHAKQQQQQNQQQQNQQQQNQQQQQYMTFEPDGGGWNNIRMAMETVVGLAIATGRTLVLPPEQRMYLLSKDRNAKSDFSFMDFFPMQQLVNDNDRLSMITMQEFLERQAMSGRMLDKETGQVSFPPNNETNWNGKDVKLLKEWLRNVTHTPMWSPSDCLAVFPASGEHADAEKLEQMLATIQRDHRPLATELAVPRPVDDSTLERMSESLAGRRHLCLYHPEMQTEPVVHFMCNHKMRVRMLVHFYAFLFFEDWREDLWMKRLMRDHMRYVDELQCAAARIVSAVRQHARSTNPSNTEGSFDTFHIRRGDFQYKNTRIDAKEIYNNVKDVLKEGSTVYIATDERSKKFFDPLKEHFDVVFMDDFMPQLEGVNKNMFGMIDQLVASRGRLFFGCWHSTFTGFINRMRGYHSVREKLAGNEDGLLSNSYYYAMADKKLALHTYAPLHGAFFNREFPTSWRQIDKGIGDLPTTSTLSVI